MKRDELKKLKIIKRVEELREKGFSEKEIKRFLELDGLSEDISKSYIKPQFSVNIPKPTRIEVEELREKVFSERKEKLNKIKERKIERNRQYQLKNKELLKEKRKAKRKGVILKKSLTN